MTQRPHRRLTMADLVILVIGSAVALGLLRFSMDTLASSFDLVLSRNRSVDRVLLVFSPFCLGIAGSLFVARIMPPRPRWRAIFRQPGTLACLAVLSHMLCLVLLWSWHVYLVPILGLSNRRINLNTYLIANRESGAWVGVAWAALALSGAWRPEPGWIDRLGRILGIVAILLWIWTGLIR